MSHAQELILAIQTNDPNRLRAVVRQLLRKADAFSYQEGDTTRMQAVIKRVRRNFDIETDDPMRLRAVIKQLHGEAAAEMAHHLNERKNKRPCYINDRLPGPLDLTALHVAAKLYSEHCADPVLANIYNRMVRCLLAAGAAPAMEIGAVLRKRSIGGNEAIVIAKHGQTVAEVCNGRLPPALLAWLGKGANNASAYERKIRNKNMQDRREAEVNAWRARKAARQEDQMMAMA